MNEETAFDDHILYFRRSQMTSKTLKKSKKAEVAGQIFIYIMAVVMVSLIMIFGYKAIGIFVNQQDYVVKLKFTNDLDSLLTKKMDYLDIELKTFDVPKQYKKVCFVSTDDGKPQDYDGIEDRAGNKLNPLVKAQWMSTDNNVFLFSGVSEFYSFKTRNMHLDTNGNGIEENADKGSGLSTFICVPTNGKLTLRIEDKGKYVFISSNVSAAI